MKKKKYSPVRILFYIILLLILIYQIYPVIWMVITSFKSPSDVQNRSTFSLPDPIFLENYINAIKKSDLLLYFKNSIVITFATLVLIVILGSLAAFAIEILKFKYSKTVLSYFLLGITIPIHITLIPLFIIYRNLGLLNTYISLVLPQVGFALPMAIYMFTAFYRFIPRELLEASIADGATVPRVFFSVYLPLSKNSIATVVTINFISVWNELIFSNTFITTPIMKTIPVGLKDFVGEYGKVDWGATFAAVTLALLPIMIIYFIFNKNIVAGMTTGAVKG